MDADAATGQATELTESRLRQLVDDTKRLLEQEPSPEVVAAHQQRIKQLLQFASEAGDGRLASQARYAAAQVLGARLETVEAAIELLEQALRDDPAHEPAVRLLDDLLTKAGNPSRKADVLWAHATLAAQSSKASEAAQATAYRRAALALRHAYPDQPDRALDAFERSVALDPEAGTLEVLAALYVDRGADGDLEQAADILTSVGEAYSGGDAIHRAQRALDLVPDHSEAMVLLERNMPERSQARLLQPRLQRYIEVAGTDEDADRWRIRLSRMYADDGLIAQALTCLEPALQRGDAQAKVLGDQLTALREGGPFADPRESTLVGLPTAGDEETACKPSSATATGSAADGPVTTDPIKTDPVSDGPIKTDPVSDGPVAIASSKSGPAMAGPKVPSPPEASKKFVKAPGFPPVTPAPAAAPSQSLRPSSDLTSLPPARSGLSRPVMLVAAATLLATATGVALWPRSGPTPDSSAASGAPSAQSTAAQAGAAGPAATTPVRQAAAPAERVQPRSAQPPIQPAKQPATEVAPGQQGATDGSEQNVQSEPLALEIVRSRVLLAGAPLDRDAFFRVLKSHESDMLGCYRRARKARPNLRGRLVFSFFLSQARVTKAKTTKGSTIRDFAFGRCIARLLNRAKLPRPVRNQTRVRLPVDFQGPNRR